jgi:hypothetical protein
MVRYTQIYLGICQESRYLSEDPLLRSGIYLTYPSDTYLGTWCPTLRAEEKNHQLDTAVHLPLQCSFRWWFSWSLRSLAAKDIQGNDVTYVEYRGQFLFHVKVLLCLLLDSVRCVRCPPCLFVTAASPLLLGQEVCIAFPNISQSMSTLVEEDLISPRQCRHECSSHRRAASAATSAKRSWRITTMGMMRISAWNSTYSQDWDTALYPRIEWASLILIWLAFSVRARESPEPR